MALAKVNSILVAKYGKDITDKLLSSYKEIEENFFLEKWKPSELDAGHFVETVRRIIEFEQNNGVYTLFNQKMSEFNDGILKKYEQSGGDESFRILIPRVLKSIYNIRNKRGVGHIKDISPNEMDATLILYSCKWVLAELVRLASNASPADTQKIIDQVVERQVEIIWKEGQVRRILNNKISAKDEVLIFLYDESPLTRETLRGYTEYKHKSNFNKLIENLHMNKLLDCTDEECKISPLGRIYAENLIKKLKTDKFSN